MQQGGRQLALHPLAEREFADLFAQERAELEQLVEFLERRRVLRLRNFVDGLVDQKGLDRGQVPQELLLLAHHQGEAAQVGRLAPVGGVAQDRSRPAGRVEQAGQDLEGGGLAGPIWPEKTDHLAGRDIERDLVNRLHGLVLAGEEGPQAAGQPRLLLVDLIVFGEVIDVDLRRH